MKYMAFGAAVLMAKFSLTCAGGAVNAAMDLLGARERSAELWLTLASVSILAVAFGAAGMALLDAALA